MGIHKKRLSFTDRVAILEVLKHRVEDVGNGECRYLDDKDTDAKVAADVGRERGVLCNGNHVAYVRRETFGALASSSSVAFAIERARDAFLETRLAAIEDRLTNLEKHILTTAQYRASYPED